jgi:hypothetical protein
MLAYPFSKFVLMARGINLERAIGFCDNVHNYVTIHYVGGGVIKFNKISWGRFLGDCLKFDL